MPVSSDHAAFGFLSRSQLRSWAVENQHPTWYIPNLIPVDGVTIVFGDGGSGKSRILLDACLSMEAGLPFCGNEAFVGEFVGSRIRTAWLSFEDAWAWEMDRRLVHHPIQVEGPLLITSGSRVAGEPDIADQLRLSRSRTFVTDAMIDATMESNWAALGEVLQSRDVRVLVVDATKGLVGGQVGRQEIAESVIELFASLRRRFGVTIVLIAHASAHKKDFGKPSDEVMGASTWSHSARHVLLVQSNTTTTFARVIKSNWGPTGFNVTFERASDQPMVILSTNSVQEYVAKKTRERTEGHFAKRTEVVQTLIDKGATDPEVWRSMRSMADAAGVSKSTIQRVAMDGWLQRTGRTGPWFAVLEKMNRRPVPVLA